MHQETTMAEAGTSPEFCYMSYATQSHGPVEIDSVEKPPNTSDQESACDNQQAGTADQQDEYESSSSDEEFEDNTHESSSESDIDETSHEAESLDSQNLFLVSRVSRFGRAVRISSRFLS